MPERLDPAPEYRQRLEARRSRVAELERRTELLANARLGVFLLGVGLAYLALAPRAVPPASLALPAVVFLFLVVRHDRVLRRLGRARRAVSFYERGQARLEDRWAGGGVAGDEYAPADHPFAADLDLFGRGSLFELLDQARTRAGEECLASWLSTPAGLGEVRSRQLAVEELRSRLDLREELAILGSDVRAGIQPKALVEWGAAAGARLPAWLRPAAWVVASGGVLTAVGWGELSWGPVPFVLVQLVNAVLTRIYREPVAEVLGAVTRPGEQLRVLAEVLARLEREGVEAPKLVALQASLSASGQRASQRIMQLDTRVRWVEARENQFFAPISWVLMWSVHGALAIEGWRRVCGPRLGEWLAAVGEMEALSSVAGYAFEHPSDPFPELVEAGPVFRAVGLGHPLLPTSRCIVNDLTLEGERRLLLVSGSNMSGKSTFLRTVGINAVLAQAGAPVRARSLALSPLAIGATLRIQDSLQEGASRFYAEITRLKRLLDLAVGPPPLLFLLDEVLAGTNSHDRLQGAEALIRVLLDRGAVGLVTTHDLALAQVADSLAPRAANAHFEDQITDGKLAFDYRLREGVVQRSNAIALMRAVGLPL